MNRRAFLKVLSLLPGMAVAEELVDVTRPPIADARWDAAVSAWQGAVIYVETTAGERAFAAPAEMWKITESAISYAGVVTFVAEEQMSVGRVSVMIPGFGLSPMLREPCGIPMNAGDSFNLVGSP
ncbi:MAG: hypothetical protein IPJ61_18380 [Tessaracoccus sp.]|uniref:hypothetical protein n=1 Tax=Tessaracoccus sp. TaxID=1971211 RepID=UPI001EC18FE7|nr:hypothetical protein [Tessaracoccus sp.]MBK7822952.1 hypothetical protein [Tessaracoccus sp.]